MAAVAGAEFFLVGIAVSSVREPRRRRRGVSASRATATPAHLQHEGPAPHATWGGAIAPTFFADAPGTDDGRGEVVLNG